MTQLTDEGSVARLSARSSIKEFLADHGPVVVDRRSEHDNRSSIGGGDVAVTGGWGGCG
jgi:hypothetical protein